MDKDDEDEIGEDKDENDKQQDQQQSSSSITQFTLSFESSQLLLILFTDVSYLLCINPLIQKELKERQTIIQSQKQKISKETQKKGDQGKAAVKKGKGKDKEKTKKKEIERIMKKLEQNEFTILEYRKRRDQLTECVVIHMKEIVGHNTQFVGYLNSSKINNKRAENEEQDDNEERINHIGKNKIKNTLINRIVSLLPKLNWEIIPHLPHLKKLGQ
ncbi:MAG: hypothetical protein EZS28_048667 [Streblomastix strix]|uniref:Uncharacterized protein n=1 Tax=Streblomastix strix TaxID=222440 RepID=A0A5J4TBM0_9EUKA|nr:MAG: hypothetical protein EZS28_048667 [Streblomastix strix]